MGLNEQEYADVLTAYGLNEWPRKLGNPAQVVCSSMDGFIPWWKANHGRWPLFTSHNAMFPTRHGYRIHMTKLFADLDTGPGPGGAMRTGEMMFDDAVKLSEFLVSERISHGWVYSGNPEGGLHLYLFPLEIWEDESEASRHVRLSQIYNAVWRGLLNHLGLQTLDQVCIEPSRLCRLPFTRYVAKVKTEGKPPEYKPYPTWCIPLPWDFVHTMDLKGIQTLALHPDGVHPSVIKDGYIFRAPPIDIEAWVKKQQWERYGPNRKAFHRMPTTSHTGRAIEMLPMMAPRMLCIQKLACEVSPPHNIRLTLAAMLRFAPHLPMGTAVEYIQKLAQESGWTDYNPDLTAYFVRHAYEKGYQPYSCQKLRDSGCCLGPACEKFASEFPEEGGAGTISIPFSELVSPVGSEDVPVPIERKIEPIEEEVFYW